MQVLLNAHTITSFSQAPLGIAIDTTLAILNHSCVPNTAVIYSGLRLDLRPIQKIGKGEELTISYIDTLDFTSYRKRELTQRYYFDCTCRRCQTPDPLNDKNKLHLAEEATNLQSQATKANQTISFTSKTKTQQIALLEDAISLLAKAQWPRDIQPYPSICTDRIEAYSRKLQWLPAIDISLTRSLHQNPYPSPLHPACVMNDWVLLKTIIGFATDYLQDPTTGEEGVHGSNSPTTMDMRKRLRDVDFRTHVQLWQRLPPLLYRHILALAHKSHGEDSRLMQVLKRWGKEVGFEDLSIFADGDEKGNEQTLREAIAGLKNFLKGLAGRDAFREEFRVGGYVKSGAR